MYVLRVWYDYLALPMCRGSQEARKDVKLLIKRASARISRFLSNASTQYVEGSKMPSSGRIDAYLDCSMFNQSDLSPPNADFLQILLTHYSPIYGSGETNKLLQNTVSKQSMYFNALLHSRSTMSLSNRRLWMQSDGIRLRTCLCFGTQRPT
jgi:hypothetical protein